MTTITAPVVDERQHGHVTTLTAARGVARRSLHNIRRLPSAFVPAVLMPIFQTIAFSGTFFAVTQIPGFPTDRSINWYLPLAITMGSAFSGVGIGFSTIRDLESGFYDRLRMSPAPRSGLLLGLLFAAWVRTLIVVTVAFLVGLLFGARLTDGILGLVLLYVAGLGMATIGSGWGIGLAYRFRDMRAAAIMQLTLFFFLFLSSAQTPLSVMQGWLHSVARVNPITNILRLGRAGFLGDITWDAVWGGLVAIAVLGSLSMWFARRGLATLDD
jgi:ABC-2 type transport system permease protein